MPGRARLFDLFQQRPAIFSEKPRRAITAALWPVILDDRRSREGRTQIAAGRLRPSYNSQVPEISTIKKALPGAGRLTNALLVAAKGFVISLARIAYALWLEVTGLIFGVFTVWGASTLVKQYRADHFADRGRMIWTLGITLALAWFTLLSFVRARKTRR